jgi:hypothetical protein
VALLVGESNLVFNVISTGEKERVEKWSNLRRRKIWGTDKCRLFIWSYVVAKHILTYYYELQILRRRRFDHFSTLSFSPVEITLKTRLLSPTSSATLRKYLFEKNIFFRIENEKWLHKYKHIQYTLHTVLIFYCDIRVFLLH